MRCKAVSSGIAGKENRKRRTFLILSVLMAVVLCACGQRLPEKEETAGMELPDFGAYTGLTEFLSENEVVRIIYRPGTMGSEQELYVTDAGEVDAIVGQLEKVRISGITDSTVTDWYPSIILEARSGAELHFSFDGEWLEGRNVNYELSGMDSVWKLIRTNAKEPDPLTSGDFAYEIIGDGEAEITEYTGAGGTVVIPETVDGFTVTSIGYKAFCDCDEISGLSLPDSVSRIGRNAFAYCDGLTCFRFSGENLEIGTAAFEYCDLLGEIEISGGNIVIGSGAFHYCRALNTVRVQGRNVTVGNDAFEYCSALTEASVSGTESETIAEDAFSYCGNGNFAITE